MKVIVFPHSPYEFPDPYDLYLFIGGLLREREGNYRIRTDSHLDDNVPRRSFVLFHKKDVIVGYAVVETPPRKMINPDYDELLRESKIYGYKYEPELYDRIIKFFPESIVALGTEHWIPRKSVEKIVAKENIYRDYIELPSDAITKILSCIP